MPSLRLPNGPTDIPPRRLPISPLPDQTGVVSGADGRTFAFHPPELLRQLVGKTLTLDENHAEVHQAPTGQPSRAQARLTNFGVEGGFIWADAEWTPAGLETWRSGGYQDLSPTFLVRPDGKTVVGLHSVGMVNTPNLELPLALNSATGRVMPPEPEKPEQPVVPDFAALIAAALAPLTEKFDAALAALTAKVEATTAATNALKTEIGTVQTNAQDAEANAFVESAITDGKIVRSDEAKAEWLKLFKAEPNAARAAMAKQPKLAPNGKQSTPAPNNKGKGEGDLTPAEIKIREAFGNKADFKPRRLVEGE